MKIKFKLTAWDEHTLIFKIQDMDERLRCMGECEGNRFDCTNVDIQVVSNIIPEILVTNGVIDKIFLRGSSQASDKKVVVVTVSNAEVAKKRVLDALQEWAEYCDNFVEKEHIKKESDVYTF